MISHETKVYRSGISTDLRNFAEFLDRQKITRTAIPIKKAATECGGDEGDDNQWAYKIERLLIPISEMKCYPLGVCDSQVEISLEVSGNCRLDSEHHDPLNKLESEIIVTGKLANKELFCSWHFDRHISDVNSNEPEAAHPRYHMHFGGRRMTKSGADFGAALLLASPRLPHPPLDGILFIDFILSNFAENKWRHVRMQSQYLRLIRQSQERLWRPYVRSISNGWTRPWPSEWSPLDIWPHFAPAM